MPLPKALSPLPIILTPSQSFPIRFDERFAPILCVISVLFLDQADFLIGLGLILKGTFQNHNAPGHTIARARSAKRLRSGLIGMHPSPTPSLPFTPFCTLLPTPGARNCFPLATTQATAAIAIERLAREASESS